METRPMRTAPRRQFPEVVLSTSELTKIVGREVARGHLKKIGPRLYTTNNKDAPAEIVRRNLWVLLGQMVPNAIVGYRTALDGTPGPDGRVYLSGPYARTIRLPGHTVHIARGPAGLERDAPFVGGLYLASPERALLESAEAAHRRGGLSRGISDRQLQDRLERTLQIGGERALNELRDRARGLAPALRAHRTFARIDEIIATLLGTRRATVTSPGALARLAGRPYDPTRLSLFESLLAELRGRPGVSRPDRNIDDDAWRHSAFFDAYFSNYIEGTEFEIGEALAIVFDNEIPAARPKDAHDILGTFRLLTDRAAIAASAVAGDSDAFIASLRERHARMLGARPEVRPGEFKTEANRAGETVFVAPELVPGTLQQGFEMMRALSDPFALAAFVMFLIAEVHPFEDGNGRLARVFMNAELAAARETRVIVPTVYRDDYLQALRALSRRKRPAALVEMLDRAQRFASELDFRILPRVTEVLTACDAFLEPAEGRLRLPSEGTRRRE